MFKFWCNESKFTLFWATVNISLYNPLRKQSTWHCKIIIFTEVKHLQRFRDYREAKFKSNKQQQTENSHWTLKRAIPWTFTIKCYSFFYVLFRELWFNGVPVAIQFIVPTFYTTPWNKQFMCKRAKAKKSIKPCLDLIEFDAQVV